MKESSIREHLSSMKKPTPRGKAWEPPTESDFARGVCIGFDQTLGKTGWALLSISNTSGIRLLRCGIIQPKNLTTGFEGTFSKAAQIGSGLEALRDSMDEYHAAMRVFHEMPAVRGHRTESSLMAAREVRRVFNRADVSAVNRRTAYKYLTGEAGSPKSAMKPAIERLGITPPPGDPWNQDVHDAVAVALTGMRKSQ